jgi:hypothetical protein
MAKENKTRFPSDANKQIVKPGDKSAPLKKEPEQKTVTGVKQDLVKIHYKKKNHHVISGVHSIRHGDNHIPRSVLNDALKHPSTLQLIKDQDLIIPADYYKDSEAPKMPEDEVESDESDDDTGTTQDTTEGDDIEKSEK